MQHLGRPLAVVVAGLVLSLSIIWSAVSHIYAVESGREITLQAIGYDKTVVAEMMPWDDTLIAGTSAAMDRLMAR